MKIVFRWEDRNQAAPADADIYWTRDMLVEDLAYPNAPAVHQYGQGRIDTDDLDEALRERIERSLKYGITSGREQIIEMPHLDSQLQYLGTLAWSLLGESRKEKVWIATKMRQPNPDAPRVRLRLTNRGVHPFVLFSASDLASFSRDFRGAWQHWRAHAVAPPTLELHVHHRGQWWFVTEPGVATRLITVADPTAADLQRYWKGVLEALAFFANADAARRPNPAFEMTLEQAYRELGLAPGADAAAVTSAYRKLSKQHHPDRGGDLVTMQRINVARDLIEKAKSGGATTTSSSRPSSPPPQQERRDFWWRAKPSGNYTVQDLRRVADWVLSMGLRQVMYRGRVDSVPIDARIGNNEYTRPFGSVVRREKLPDGIEADPLAATFERYLPGSAIFDIGMTKDVAWITWVIERSGPPHYQSVSFERPTKRTPKPKGVGMKPSEAADVMRELGLRDVAGGTKYGYWTVPMPGRIEKTGIFVRTSKRTLRLVKRERSTSGIEDYPLGDEVYYGDLTRAQLEQWAQYIRTPHARNPVGRSTFTGFDVFEEVEDVPEPERSATSRAFAAMKRDDIVTVGKTKWKVVRVEGAMQALVYKHPSKGKKLYMIQATDEDDTVEVYELNGMGERLATATTGPLRAASS